MFYGYEYLLYQLNTRYSNVKFGLIYSGLKLLLMC